MNRTNLKKEMTGNWNDSEIQELLAAKEDISLHINDSDAVICY